MNMIPKEALEEFKEIYKKEFKEDLSDEEAMEKAVSLLNLFKAVYRPVKKDWLKDLENKEI